MTDEERERDVEKLREVEARFRRLLLSKGKDHPKTINTGAECFDRAHALRRNETLAQYRRYLAAIPK